jgi:polyisoprenoid-binding protein YceI
MNKSIRTLGILTAIVAMPLLAGAKLARSGGASVTFTSIGPAGLKIEGKTTELNVDEAGDKVRVTVPLAKLDTGIELRNKHMREKYLVVDKFPQAELLVAKSALKYPKAGETSTGAADGTLSVHGQTRPAKINYTVKLEGDTYVVSATTHLNMKDYGIEVPSYLGVTVKPDVDVAVSFRTKDN